EVGVGVVAVDGGDRLVGQLPGRVDGRARPAGRPGLTVVAPAVGTDAGSAPHPSFSPDSTRTPRAHASAAIGRLPGACPGPSTTGLVVVPARTRLRSTSSAPGARLDPPSKRTGSGDTGPSLRRSSRNMVHAPGAGVHARIRRSTANAG